MDSAASSSKAGSENGASAANNDAAAAAAVSHGSSQQEQDDSKTNASPSPSPSSSSSSPVSTKTVTKKTAATVNRLRQRTVGGTKKAAQGTKAAVKTVVVDVRERLARNKNRKNNSKKDDDDDDDDDDHDDSTQERGGGQDSCNGDHFAQKKSASTVTPDDVFDEQSSVASHSMNSTMTISSSNTNRAAAIVVGPLFEFLTADTTLFWIFCFVVALHPTIRNWSSIVGGNVVDDDNYDSKKSVAMSVVGPWLVLAFATGQVVGHWMGSTHYGLHSLPRHRRKKLLEEISAPRPDGTAALPLEIAIEKQQQMFVQESKKKTHSLFMSIVGSRAKIRFSDNIQKKTGQLLRAPKGAWTTLKRKRTFGASSSTASTQTTLLEWQTNMDPLKKDAQNSALVRRLSQRFHAPRVRRESGKDPSAAGSLGTPSAENKDVTTSPPAKPNTSMGAIDLSLAPADSLNDCLSVKPLFRLRGMDVFLSEDADANVGSHPWLISQGLRDVPTFTVNILTQWGNILIYLELPEWCKNFDQSDCLEETEADPDDTKALKRFLRGDDEYRNARLKMIPSLVEGPMPIRMVAPPKEEITVHCDSLPISWKKKEGDGEKLCPHLEVTLDCMTSRTIRSMASLIKKYLKKLSIDVAIVIAKPENVDKPEPMGCLGIWRFHHIDVSQCPQLPDRFEVEAEAFGPSPGLLRASQVLGLSTKEMKELAAEVQ